MRLIPPPGAIVGGEIEFQGRNLLTLSNSEIRAVRGNEIGMIFQEPMTSLNPVKTIGDQIVEAVACTSDERAATLEGAIEMLTSSAFPTRAARRRISAPDVRRHAAARNDRDGALLATRTTHRGRADDRAGCDHPGADPRPDARAAARVGMAILFITHDLGVVAEMADRVVVMYAGRVVEEGDVRDIFARPRMPYTAGSCVPSRGSTGPRGAPRLETIAGSVPNLLRPPRAVRSILVAATCEKNA